MRSPERRKPAPITAATRAPPHHTASGEVASTARRQGSRTHTWRRCRLRRSHLSLGNSRPQHSAQVVLTKRPEARLVHTLLRPCPTGRLRRPLAPTPMAPAAAVSWQVQRRRSSGSTPSRERAAHLIGVYVERSAGELGITQAEAHVMAELHRHGPTQIAALHREFGHKRSTPTSILDRLERRKLIRRELNPDDRRSFVIHLTASGTRAASRVTDALDELERSPVARWTPTSCAASRLSRKQSRLQFETTLRLRT